MTALAADNPQSESGDSEEIFQLDTVVVSGTFRKTPAAEVPASVSVVGKRELQEAGKQHFGDVLGLVPNLNWSGGSSRPRYFQLRGIGELEQYQGAPNPSVGFLIDDIDFSGLGGAATLFDLDQVEVLRGPQSTRYGANALAGLIYTRSAAPENVFGGRVEVGAGNYGERSYGAVLTGPVEDLRSGFRLAVQKYESDGFYDNTFLGRDNTNRRKETTLRGRWRYDPAPGVRLDLSALHVDIDNGYDAFALDNTRNVLADKPGVDAQKSTGLSARLSSVLTDSLSLTVIGAYAKTDSDYSYDSDWGNPQNWAPYTYDFISDNLRERKTHSLEARLEGGSTTQLEWVVGVYASELRESLRSLSSGTLIDPDPDFGYTSLSDTTLASRYRARNIALYGELNGELAQRWRWSAGLRGERRTTRYSDAEQSFGELVNENNFSPTDNLVGGNVSLTYLAAENQSVYVTAGRSYKAGGFNLTAGLSPDRREYQDESLWNVETGYKALLDGGRLRLNTALFYMRRNNPQLRTSDQAIAGDPNTFVFLTVNAPRGTNYGFEGSAQWQLSPSFELGGTLGLLRTKYEGLLRGGAVSPSRDQPHAPRWQTGVNATWRASQGWFARVDVTGSDSFYFDLPPNETKSSPYFLTHAKIGWESKDWSISLWGRNLFDRDYAVRGFYFGNEPPAFENKKYLQLGEPRQFGVTLTARF